MEQKEEKINELEKELEKERQKTEKVKEMEEEALTTNSQLICALSENYGLNNEIQQLRKDLTEKDQK